MIPDYILNYGETLRKVGRQEALARLGTLVHQEFAKSDNFDEREAYNNVQRLISEEMWRKEDGSIK